MKRCSNCGHELGVGRYCTNCGVAVGPVADDAPAADLDWRTDTAERPPVPPPPPRTPPPSIPPPSTWPPPAPAGAATAVSPRFPLFADELAPAPVAEATPHRAGGPRWPVWLAVAAVLIVVAALGVRLLASDDTPAASGSDGDPTNGAADPSGTKHSPGKKHHGDEAPAAPGDVTADAAVDVPATAPAGVDVAGNQVDYDADNMLDGVPETTWRMPGDGSGAELTITLPDETTLRSVGLINGYAKAVEGPHGGKIDWYHGNRRIQQVEWVFDDGTIVPQTLGDTTALQSIDVDATTTTIVLRLVTVSPPGTGPAARNYTAISDLSLISAG